MSFMPLEQKWLSPRQEGNVLLETEYIYALHVRANFTILSWDNDIGNLLCQATVDFLKNIYIID